jgi:hypothetical protein
LAPGGKKLSKKMKRLAKAQKKRGLAQNAEPDQDDEPEQNQEVDELEGLSPEERKQKLLEALDEYHKLDCEDMVCPRLYPIMDFMMLDLLHGVQG